jgi:methylated-DNA-protein-cysteine methyltransferase-like protein
VGYALANAPDGLALPWHRVVNGRGKISLRSRPGSDDFQQVLLEAEGVEFGLAGKIWLSHYQWNPRIVIKRGKAAVRSKPKRK